MLQKIYVLYYEKKLTRLQIAFFTAYLVTILKVLNRVFGLENMSKTFWVFFLKYISGIISRQKRH